MGREEEETKGEKKRGRRRKDGKEDAEKWNEEKECEEAREERGGKLDEERMRMRTKRMMMARRAETRR